MGINNVWHTNTVVYYLQRQLPRSAEKFMDALLKKEPPVFSAITEIELLSWKSATPADLKMLHEFIGDATIIELEKSIKWKTADLRKTYRIKLPDAIIAATALVYDATLLSRNVSDFDSIVGVKLMNPWDK